MPLFDAHCHLQDSRLDPYRDEALSLCATMGVERMVANGTSPQDWENVENLAGSSPLVFPSFGLHPWQVGKTSDDWRDKLQRFLHRWPNAGVGEVGLDRWIDGYDIEAQTDAFTWQVSLARQGNRPLSIHCLKAWGLMLELIDKCELPERGFLLHSYGGPREMIDSFVQRGAYFSISAYFSLERKAKQAEFFKFVPEDRILIETDSPDMAGYKRFMPYSSERDDRINLPQNIKGLYAFAAELLGKSQPELEARVEENFRRFFL